MKKRVTYIALLALGFLCVGIYFQTPADPVYKERKLSAWLNDLHPGYSGHQNQVERENAAEAIRAIGTNGLPYLLALVRTRDSSLRTNFIELTKKQTLIKWHFRPPAFREQFIGILGLRSLGPTAVIAVPDLLSLLKEGDWSVRAVAAECLGLIGGGVPAVIPALLTSLEETNSYVRESALRGLGQLTPLPPQVLSAVEKHLHDPLPELRSESLAWLLNHSTNRVTYLPALTAQFKDESPDVRGGALRSASWFTNSPGAVLQLIELSLNDTNISVRMLATNIFQIVSAANPTVMDSKRDIFFSFENTPVAQVLDTYSSIARQKVVVPIPLFGFVRVKTYGTVTAAEALTLMDAALREQLHIVIARTDDGRLVAVVAPQRK